MTLPTPPKHDLQVSLKADLGIAISPKNSMFANIYREFEEGAILTAQGFDIVIQKRSLGLLHLPEGNLVACDVLTHPGSEPFDLAISPGHYTVRLVTAALRDEVRVAYAIVELAKEPAQRWHLAPILDEPLDAAESGYAVVSGMGAFLDQTTATRLIEYNAIVPEEENELLRTLRQKLRRTSRSGPGFAKMDLGFAQAPHLNLMVFDAGYGEGLYRSWVGTTHAGKVTRLVTDFQVLELQFPAVDYFSRKVG